MKTRNIFNSATHWLIFTLANLLILFACSKASDDDNPNPEPQPKPTPEQPSGFVTLDQQTIAVKSTEYSIRRNGNYEFFLYLSDKSKTHRVGIWLNQELHFGKTVALTQKDKAPKGKWPWTIEYYADSNVKIIDAGGKEGDDRLVFKAGTLELTHISGNTFSVELLNGKVEDADGQVRSFAITYKGEFTKVGETPKTDTDAPEVVGTIEVVKVTETTASLKWKAAIDLQTPSNKLVYTIFWQKEGSSEVKSEELGNRTSYELTGLEKESTYTVWLTVRDEAGNEATYPKKEFINKEDTEAPKLLGKIAIKDITNNKAVLQWPKATDNKTHSDDLIYTLYWKEKGSTKEWMKKDCTNQTECVIENLTLDTNYTVLLTIQDKAGNKAEYQTQFTTSGKAIIFQKNRKIRNVGYYQVQHSGAVYWFVIWFAGGEDFLTVELHKDDFNKTIDLSKSQKKNDNDAYYWKITYGDGKGKITEYSGDPKKPQLFARGTLKVQGTPEDGFISIEIDNASTQPDLPNWIVINYKGKVNK